MTMPTLERRCRQALDGLGVLTVRTQQWRDTMIWAALHPRASVNRIVYHYLLLLAECVVPNPCTAR